MLHQNKSSQVKSRGYDGPASDVNPKGEGGVCLTPHQQLLLIRWLISWSDSTYGEYQLFRRQRCPRSFAAGWIRKQNGAMSSGTCRSVSAFVSSNSLQWGHAFAWHTVHNSHGEPGRDELPHRWSSHVTRCHLVECGERDQATGHQPSRYVVARSPRGRRRAPGGAEVV